MNIHEAIEAMHEGASITHPDWDIGEYIKILDGEIVDENDTQFALSPWMIDCNIWTSTNVGLAK